MPPITPTIWATRAVGSERLRLRLDARHRELTLQAKTRGREYRDAREDGGDAASTLRAEFLAALGRLSAFEAATLRLARCRYAGQLSMYADTLSRDYFELWTFVARRAVDRRELDETALERFDIFATQIGRLEGIADALVVAGRNVRLFPLPPMPWVAA